MKQTIMNFFEGMRPLEISEYMLLGLTLCTLPFSFNVAVWCIVALIANTVVKGFAYRERPQSFDTWKKWGFGLLIAYFILYLISMTYTANLEMGWENICHKLPFLILPLFFLASPHNYLGTNRIRWLFYAFAGACTILFAAHILTCLWKLAFVKDSTFNCFFSIATFVKHHTYHAMYFLLIVAFVYNELTFRWKDLPRWQRNTLIACGVSMMIYIYLIQSRSGILCLCAIEVWALIHILISHKHYKMELLAVCLTILVTAGIMIFSDGTHNRLANTIVETVKEGEKDVRFEIAKNSMQVIEDHWLIGVGIGDRMDELNKNHDEQFGIDEEHPWRYNPHNQYLDSWVALGILGPLLLIVLLALPFIVGLRKKYRDENLLALLFLVGSTALFESIFERQMGILFFCLFYGILLLPGARSMHKTTETS